MPWTIWDQACRRAGATGRGQVQIGRGSWEGADGELDLAGPDWATWAIAGPRLGDAESVAGFWMTARGGLWCFHLVHLPPPAVSVGPTRGRGRSGVWFAWLGTGQKEGS